MGRSAGGSFESKVPGRRYVSYQNSLEFKQVPTAKCWSTQAASDRRITFNESLLCSHWPDGGTWSRWDEGGCSVWNFLPTQTEAAGDRPSIYSRLIAEVHVTSRILQVVALVILKKHAISERQALMTRYLMPAPWTGISHSIFRVFSSKIKSSKLSTISYSSTIFNQNWTISFLFPIRPRPV